MAGSAIFEAVAKGDLKQLKAISKKVDDKLELRKICDEYYDFSTGRNVLHHAAGIGHFDICKFLIEGVQVYINSFTFKNNIELVQLLLMQGGLVDRDSVDGTPLQIAVSRGNVEAVKCLLSHGANPSYYDAIADTPLLCALI
ncbi:E3 ubiquitin-protein ligase MIB2-like [Salvia splendens]|uniref:E3 ubiquitin-protein ligase MIB2-like n=1 Tax=Salvia splendens TaxID=180675 RepID=UPI001C27C4DF|nr:E3 ubiquitin-protein ligase MIB2-like [Salvia splendens]